MQKYIHSIEKLKELFDKINYESQHFWATYTWMMFELKNPELLNTFWEFLLHYLRISDTVFYYSENRILLILEETTLRWAILLNEKLREKIKEKWFSFDFYSAAVQWNFIDDIKALEKSLKKRLKKAKEDNTQDCIYSLSNIDN